MAGPTAFPYRATHDDYAKVEGSVGLAPATSTKQRIGKRLPAERRECTKAAIGKVLPMRGLPCFDAWSFCSVFGVGT